MINDRKRSMVAKRQQFRVNMRLAAKQSREAIGSNQLQSEDVFETQGFYDQYGLLIPPYKPLKLYMIHEESAILPKCVSAMVDNIPGFGYDVQWVGDGQQPIETDKNKQTINGICTKANEKQSLISLRKETRKDLEITGNAYIEVIRAKRTGEIMLLYRSPAVDMRLAPIQKDPISVQVNLPRGGIMLPVTIHKRFRKFACVNQAGTDIRWFKEFGDPRFLDAITGEYVDTPEEAEMLANEIIHQKIDCGISPYGMPRWIGNILRVLGSQSADYVNYDLFENQGIPPFLVMVSGGMLTEESLDELEDLFTASKGVKQFNKVAILEAEDMSGSMEDKTKAKIDIKALIEYRKEDAMFTTYIKDTASSVRQAFRLPPLFVGDSEEYCYSEDTETLTENGWKLYHNIKTNEKIASYNKDTDKIEYHIPDELAVFDKKVRRMVLVQNDNVDFMVTLDHEMWVRIDDNNGEVVEEWHRCLAGDLLIQDPSYVIYAINDQLEDVAFSSSDVTELDYRGKVYCFLVKNHLFVTRRNGKSIIASNTFATSKTSRLIAEEQIFKPERKLEDELFNSTIFQDIELWSLRTKGPEVIRSDELATMFSHMTAAGAITINDAIRIANTMFDLKIPIYEQSWAQYPILLVKALLASSDIAELDEMGEEVKGLMDGTKAPGLVEKKEHVNLFKAVKSVTPIAETLFRVLDNIPAEEAKKIEKSFHETVAAITPTKEKTDDGAVQ